MFKISLETVFKINTESFDFYREIGSSPEIFILIQTSNRQNPLFFISTFIRNCSLRTAIVREIGTTLLLYRDYCFIEIEIEIEI